MQGKRIGTPFVEGRFQDLGEAVTERSFQAHSDRLRGSQTRQVFGSNLVSVEDTSAAAALTSLVGTQSSRVGNGELAGVLLYPIFVKEIATAPRSEITYRGSRIITVEHALLMKRQWSYTLSFAEL